MWNLEKYTKTNKNPCFIREKTDSYSFTYTERHLQCVWFDPSYRPPDIESAEGEPVRIIHPGRWNLEAGPDFLDATLSIGNPQRVIRGDIEIHIHPNDWEHHKHSGDPRYNGVIAHVTYFPDATSRSPESMINIYLKDSLATIKRFSFESIDITAYPFQNIAKDNPPCTIALKQHTPEYFGRLLSAAGISRLKQKTNRIADAADHKGIEQVFYEEIMRALGYKNNRTAFKLLCKYIPLGLLRSESANDTNAAYALLLGTAGLLPELKATADKDTRTFIRSLWDHWWRMNDKLEKRSLNRNVWCLGGLRPHNHPARRLAAAAAIFTLKDGLFKTVAQIYAQDPVRLNKNLQTFMREQAIIPFWKTKLSFYGKTQKHQIALVGPMRVAAIITNSVIPCLAAENDIPLEKLTMDLPPEENNSIIRQCAHILLGADHNPAIYRSGLEQQGLVQIFHDFCLDNKDGCLNCRLAQTLQNDISNILPANER